MAQMPEVTSAQVSRGSRGALVVEIDGMTLGERPHLASAVHMLCEYSMVNRKPLVVTVASGAGRQYMMIDINGVVTPCAAPAPRSATPRRNLSGAAAAVPRSEKFGLPEERNLAYNPKNVITSNEWVEKFILNPGQEDASRPAAAPRPRTAAPTATYEPDFGFDQPSASTPHPGAGQPPQETAQAPTGSAAGESRVDDSGKKRRGLFRR